MRHGFRREHRQPLQRFLPHIVLFMVASALAVAAPLAAKPVAVASRPAVPGQHVPGEVIIKFRDQIGRAHV